MQKDTLFPKTGFSRISVYGLGVSNTPCLRFLLSRGFTVEALDDKPFAALPYDTQKEIRELSASGAPFTFFQKTEESRFAGELVLRAPGLRPEGEIFKDARRRGIPVLTEAGLSLSHLPLPSLAVTGSDGKSTTATLLSAMLSHSGRRVFFGGNIGKPLLPSLPEMAEARDGVAVMELSSFQLYDAPVSPTAALLTNLSENHLNWHKDYAEYAAAKLRAFSGAERVIFSADDAGSVPFLSAMAYRDDRQFALFSVEKSRNALCSLYGRAECAVVEDGNAVYYAENGTRVPLFSCAAMRLRGLHNLKNMLAAALLAYPYATPDAISDAAARAVGLPHRIELVRRENGIDFIDSSVDTSPARTASTLRAVGTPVLALLGGASKGVSYQSLAPLLADTARAVFLSGETGGEICHVLLSSRVFQNAGIPVFLFDSLRDAVHAACRYAVKGDTVLLTPASTSFDAFRNFEERGNAFRLYVAEFFGEEGEKNTEKSTEK